MLDSRRLHCDGKFIDLLSILIYFTDVTPQPQVSDVDEQSVGSDEVMLFYVRNSTIHQHTTYCNLY